MFMDTPPGLQKMVGRAAPCLRTRVPPDIPGNGRYRLRIALAVDTIAPPGQPDGGRTPSGRDSAYAIPTSLASIRTGPALGGLTTNLKNA